MWICKCLWSRKFSLLGICVEVVQLGHMALLCLHFWETSRCISKLCHQREEEGRISNFFFFLKLVLPWCQNHIKTKRKEIYRLTSPTNIDAGIFNTILENKYQTYTKNDIHHSFHKCKNVSKCINQCYLSHIWTQI